MQILIKNIRSVEFDIIEKKEYVDEKRWENIQRMKSDADKKRSMASAFLLKAMCDRLQIENPVYTYTENGKPYLVNNKNIAFNISHSGDYSMLAYLESSDSVGADIQQIRFMKDGMERRLLHEKEIMESQLLQEKKEYLNRIWVIKESYVKMTGEGLSHDFRDLYVDFENGKIEAGNRKPVYFWEQKWKEDYILAVCTQMKIMPKPEEI